MLNAWLQMIIVASPGKNDIQLCFSPGEVVFVSPKNSTPNLKNADKKKGGYIYKEVNIYIYIHAYMYTNINILCKCNYLYSKCICNHTYTNAYIYIYTYSYYFILQYYIYTHSSIYSVNYVTQSLVLRPFFDQMQPETQWCSEAQVYHLSWSMFHAVCCWKKCIYNISNDNSNSHDHMYI